MVKMTQCLEQCGCDVCKERERRNAFIRAVRIVNLYELRSRKIGIIRGCAMHIKLLSQVVR